MSCACQRYQICLNRYVTRGLGALYGGIGMTLFLCHQGNPKKTATNGDVLERNLWKPSSSLLSSALAQQPLARPLARSPVALISLPSLLSSWEVVMRKMWKRTKQSTKSDPWWGRWPAQSHCSEQGQCILRPCGRKRMRRLAESLDEDSTSPNMDKQATLPATLTTWALSA